MCNSGSIPQPYYLFAGRGIVWIDEFHADRKPSSVTRLYEGHSEIRPGRHLDDTVKDMARFAISSYNKYTTNAEYEVEQIEEVRIKYKELPVYRLTFTAKDGRAGRLDNFEAKVWESKNKPAEETKTVEYCRMIKPDEEPKTVKYGRFIKPELTDDSLEIKIQRAVAIARSYYPTVLHDNRVAVVCPVKPACPPIRKITSQSQSEFASQFEKRSRENLGFYADVEPGMLRNYGGGGRENPDEIRAAREENYMNMARLAIAAYNKENLNTEFEVEQVEKANLEPNAELQSFAYDLTFTAKDVRAAASPGTLETFEAVIRVFLGNPYVGERYTLELCRIKSI
ncbi:hypothetical protein OROMI_003193 [Orobanche minor]